MSNPSEKVLAASGLSRNNREALEQSHTAACYACQETFPARKITEWTDGHQTALCPFCGVDAVLPATEGAALTPALLKEMGEYYFASPVDWKLREKTTSFFAELPLA